MTSLNLFHSLVRHWFINELGVPTDVQEKSWPVIARGTHVLINAPTGSGKTLTAFLWALNQLIVGAYPVGRIRVLYVSPLKALNNDIRRNLLQPLQQLKSLFTDRDLDLPAIRVLTRSGDTPGYERQRMLRHPPEILITTPESLNILLSSSSSRRLLTGLAAVIIDEIHAVAGNKRGTHLITGIERLVPLSGEFQRIGLTATVRPAELIADFLGGFKISNRVYSKREVTIIQSEQRKRIDIRVCYPEDRSFTAEQPLQRITGDSAWDALVKEFRAIIDSNRSTLLFVNSRRLSERLVRLINESADRIVAYSHHGSLSRELRRVVEQRLKEGRLSAVVATNSLELGIDIGSLDEVILVQTPFSVSSALQRAGRSGHRVGQTSRARIFPTHGGDFLEASVMAAAVSAGDIEEIHPVLCPLDVLAQVIVSMTCVQRWNIDELFSFLRSSYPYHNLKRRQFDLVLDMLAGRYADTRVRELRPRVSIDRIDNTAEGREGVQYLLFLAGGTISDRGYYTLRTHDSKAIIGELDEEFVWERSVGDSFTLGAQSWRIERIGHQDVEVIPTRLRSAMAPFWKAEAMDRDFFFSEKIALFLEEWNERLENSGARAELQDQYALDSSSAKELLQYLKRQRQETEADLPHRHHILIEHCQQSLDRSDNEQVILYTFWGGKVNRPFSMALAQAWEEKHGYPLEVYVDNSAIMLSLAHEFGREDLVDLVRPDNLESLLRSKLETTGLFGARFRECASIALLLPRAGFKRRTPLWLNRLRAKRLLSAVSRYEDFPILVETWRCCLQDEFDLVSLERLLDEVRRGTIRISAVSTRSPSPFSAGLVWRQTNRFMYEDDTPRTRGRSNLSEDLIREAALSSRIRPDLSPPLLRDFTEKLQRIAPGYAPSTSRDLLDWAKERLLIPIDECDALLAAVARDHGLSKNDLLQPLEGKIGFLTLLQSDSTFLVANESVARILGCLGLKTDDARLHTSLSPMIPLEEKHLVSLRSSCQEWKAKHSNEEDHTALLGEWLRYYGPVPLERLRNLFGLDQASIDELLQSLIESKTVVVDSFSSESKQLEVCDLENLERLLRLARSEKRPSFEALGLDHLPLFLATWQGIASPGDSINHLKKSLEKLFGYSLPAAAWESEILPARLSTYHPSWLDSLLNDSDLVWRGSGARRLFFCFEEDLELFPSGRSEKGANGHTNHGVSVSSLFPDSKGRYDFWALEDHSGLSSEELTSELWSAAWKGEVSNNTFAVVRRGIETKFHAISVSPQRGGRRRHSYRHWRSSRPLTGHWYSLPPASLQRDALDKEEIARDRIDVLLTRYGVLFKELLAGELPELKWSSIFRSLRLMELSGEILSGQFFKEIPGIQFISSLALRALRRGLPDDSIYWMNASDPASLCGIQIEALKATLPKRLQTTHLVFHGRKLVIVSRKLGKDLEIRTAETDARLPRYLDFFKALMNRSFQPLKAIRVNRINDADVRTSPYLDAFLNAGFTLDYKTLILRASYI
jgi:ATP-dependent Lhr-like helicase